MWTLFLPIFPREAVPFVTNATSSRGNVDHVVSADDRKVSVMTTIETVQVAIPIGRQNVDRRPVVFQEVQIEKQPAYSTVPIAERMN